jgi:hypothetical protein
MADKDNRKEPAPPKAPKAVDQEPLHQQRALAEKLGRK